MDTSLRLHIDSLSYGPHGVGRLDGKATFVRNVVPGEEVDVVVREDHGRYAYADLVEVVTAAPERRATPCPYLPRCGGCPWQHLEYGAQLRAKEVNLREALRRIGHWAEPPVRPILATPAEFHYRGRLSLRTFERRVGFHAAASHELVEIDHCLLAGAAADRAIAVAQDLVRTVPDDVRRVEILTCERSGDVVLVGEVEGSQGAGTAAAVEAWLPQQPIAGVVLHGRRWRRTWGRDAVSVFPEADLELVATAGAFTQVNPAANRQLVAKVVELGELRPEDRVLELHAGIGNLSLPIARRVRHVVAVEQSQVAAADARANAASTRTSNIRIRTATTRTALRELGRGRDRFDLVVLDPPRSGAAEALDAILALAPKRLVYVSCNPTTLARDIARLQGAYAFDVVQPVDLFPQTYHLETVVRGHHR